ncbi:hypothetical protein BJY52DRAFT_1155509 [Lactarius psammicola]|nr:hypothetical protein BJY52DRAFT_1155509 [Lactarius psammicola]
MPIIHSDTETRKQLDELNLVYQSITSYRPATSDLPILDSTSDSDQISGLRPLLDAVKRDLDVTKQFLAAPDAAFLPPPAANAPYLIAVWKEVLSSPLPVVAIGKTFFEKTTTTDVIGRKQAHTQNSDKHKSAGIKVDVVANNGHTWIQVNTHVNARLLAEFCEIDTDSEVEDGTDNNMVGPSLAQSEFNNSLLRMGRTLLAAARDNPVLGTNKPPEVVLRLTRIDPDATEECENDSRIALTVELLRKMGLLIELGERGPITQLMDLAPTLLPPTLVPTHRINLELSILIAFVSDLTHAPLPDTVDTAYMRFMPSAEYVEWKRSRLRAKNGGGSDNMNTIEEDVYGAVGHSQRPLSEQLLREMRRGILQEIYEGLLAYLGKPTGNAPLRVEFWTTPEARDRCLRIVAKNGGPDEKRRARALFLTDDDGDDDSVSLNERVSQYWAHSRYPHAFLPLLPIRVFSSPSPASIETRPPHAGFFSALEQTCRALLASGTVTAPPPEAARDGELQRAAFVRANGGQLTVHTVQSILCGAVRGWTTLTANKARVKAILREMRARGYDAEVQRSWDVGEKKHAALWIVDPRNLVQRMRSDIGVAPA